MLVVVRETLGLSKPKSMKDEDEICRGFFGASIEIIVILWALLVPKLDDKNAGPQHMLWALVFLKVCSTTAVHRRIVGWPDAKTFRKWSWYFLEKIASLKPDVIQVDKRFEGYTPSSGTTCLMSVDGIDCMVNEPWPFDKKWYSQKFNGPAVKYEVGVCIKTGHIVWASGPFVGSASDGTIFAEGLGNGILMDDEDVEVDAGYKGHAKMKSPTVAKSRIDRKQKSQVRGRHENVNGRLKTYNVLNIPFRHLNPRGDVMRKHGLCFDSVAVITQLKFNNNDSLLCGVNYDVTYD